MIDKHALLSILLFSSAQPQTFHKLHGVEDGLFAVLHCSKGHLQLEYR